VDVVVIEAPTPEVDSAHADALAAACTAALSSGRCVVSSGGTALVRAMLSLQADGTARIALTGPGGEAERRLRFAEADAPVERWRSAGLVIGTVAEGLREKPPRPTPPPQPASPPPPRIDEPSKQEQPPPLWIDVGAQVGPALEDASARGGPVLRVGYGIADLPIAVTASAAYAYRSADDRELEVHWLTAGGGAAAVFRLLDDELWLDARAEIVAHFLAARATAGASEQAGSASRWLAGGRFGADAAWMFHRNAGAWVGLDFTVVGHGTQLTILGSPAGRAPPYEIAPQLGVRFALP
jgi:hypothetical protein